MKSACKFGCLNFDIAERNRRTLPVDDLIPDGEEAWTSSSANISSAADEDDVELPDMMLVPQASASSPPASALTVIGPLPNLNPLPATPELDDPLLLSITPPAFIGPLPNPSKLPARPERPKPWRPASLLTATPPFIGPLPGSNPPSVTLECPQQECPPSPPTIPLAFIGPLSNPDPKPNQGLTPPERPELLYPAPQTTATLASSEPIQASSQLLDVPAFTQPQHPPPSATALAFIGPLPRLLPPLATEQLAVPEADVPVLGWHPFYQHGEPLLDADMGTDVGIAQSGMTNRAQEEETIDSPTREPPDHTGWPENVIELHSYLTVHTSGVLKGQRRDWGRKWDTCINKYITFQRSSLGLDVSRLFKFREQKLTQIYLLIK